MPPEKDLVDRAMQEEDTECIQPAHNQETEEDESMEGAERDELDLQSEDDDQDEDEEAGQPLMEKVESLASNEEEVEDADDSVTSRTGGVSSADVESKVRSDTKLSQNYKRHKVEFDSMTWRLYVESIRNKDKRDEEAEDVVKWNDDKGARWAMIRDDKGKFELTDGLFVSIHGEGPVYKQSAPIEGDAVRV